MKERVRGFASSLLSRKLILSVAVILITTLNAHYDWGLTEGDVTMIVIAAASYVGLEGAKDIIEAQKRK